MARNLDRRAFVGTTSLAAVAMFARTSAAQPDKSLRADDGGAVANWRLPSQIPIEADGEIVVGGSSPDVIVAEIFDYNCPWCRKSADDIHKTVEGDHDFRLILIQNPILSLGSMQAAKVVLATKSLLGDANAYRLHRALLGSRGQMEGLAALAETERLKFDRAAIEVAADSEAIRIQLRNQMALARALGAEATPTFLAHGVAIGGWPGPKTFARIVAALRACDLIVC